MNVGEYRSVGGSHSIGPSDQRGISSPSKDPPAPVGCADPRSPRGAPTRARCRERLPGPLGSNLRFCRATGPLDAASRCETAESGRPDWGPRNEKGPTTVQVAGPQSGRPDSNRRPPEPHSGALPGCATSRGQTTIISGRALGLNPPGRHPVRGAPRRGLTLARRIQSNQRLTPPRAGGYTWGPIAGWSSLVARRAHNPKVAGSNPAPAIETPPRAAFPL